MKQEKKKNAYLQMLEESVIEFDKMQKYTGTIGDVIGFSGTGNLPTHKKVSDVVSVLERFYFQEEDEEGNTNDNIVGAGPSTKLDNSPAEDVESDVDSLAKTGGGVHPPTQGEFDSPLENKTKVNVKESHADNLVNSLFEDDDLTNEIDTLLFEEAGITTPDKNEHPMQGQPVPGNDEYNHNAPKIAADAPEPKGGSVENPGSGVSEFEEMFEGEGEEIPTGDAAEASISSGPASEDKAPTITPKEETCEGEGCETNEFMEMFEDDDEEVGTPEAETAEEPLDVDKGMSEPVPAPAPEEPAAPETVGAPVKDGEAPVKDEWSEMFEGDDEDDEDDTSEIPASPEAPVAAAPAAEEEAPKDEWSEMFEADDDVPTETATQETPAAEIAPAPATPEEEWTEMFESDDDDADDTGSDSEPAEKEGEDEAKKPFPGAAPPFKKGGEVPTTPEKEWSEMFEGDDADDDAKKPFPGAAPPFGKKDDKAEGDIKSDEKTDDSAKDARKAVEESIVERIIREMDLLENDSSSEGSEQQVAAAKPEPTANETLTGTTVADPTDATEALESLDEMEEDLDEWLE